MWPLCQRWCKDRVAQGKAMAGYAYTGTEMHAWHAIDRDGCQPSKLANIVTAATCAGTPVKLKVEC